MQSYTSLYFVGAGGIGMSALVRYFLAKGYAVAGYDKTPSALTDQLQGEGAELFFDESVSLIPAYCRNPQTTLVVRTPAVPLQHEALSWFGAQGFRIVKRAELLGLITRQSKGLCFSGTHGKTTTSSMCAHILHQSPVGCNAFLGGILKNYDTNLLLSSTSPYTVIEADEYDRSFHQLSPYMAVVTATDPDHLDIYGTAEAYRESFAHFTACIQPGGVLLAKKRIELAPRLQPGVKQYSYSAREGGDFHAENIQIGNGGICFDFVTPWRTIPEIALGVPVEINIENSIAAMAIALLNGVEDEVLRQGVASYQGAKRRFDFWLNTPQCVLIDDYAHHPDEVKASLGSVRALYPNKKITVIFQPHLYTRTRDFASEFAAALSQADQLLVLPIYPARELPIAGVTSQLILEQVTSREKELCPKEELLKRIKECTFDVLITLGAGDIDRMLPQIKELLISK